MSEFFSEAGEGGLVIVKVRIAPVENWCKESKASLHLFPKAVEAVGKFVSIHTDSMREGSTPHSNGKKCEFNEWLLTEESAAWLDELHDEPPYLRNIPTWICGSRLEMD